MTNTEGQGQNEPKVRPTAVFPVEFDPDEFMHFAADADLTEDEARALLRDIWAIVLGFAQLGFGHTPFQQVLDNCDGKQTAKSPAMLHCLEQFSHSASKTSDPRPARRVRARRDS